MSSTTPLHGDIYAQMEVSPYPFNLQSGWLPAPGSPSMQQYFDRVLSAPREEFASSIEELNKFITENEMIAYLLDNAFRENKEHHRLRYVHQGCAHPSNS